LESVDDLKHQLSAALADKETAEKTWRCFNCGFETQDDTEALAHFGNDDHGKSICVTWAELNADGRAQEYQSQVEERNATEEENTKLRQENETLEDWLGGIEGEIASRFKGCRTVNDAFNLYDSMEGRALASEERAETAEARVGKLAEALRQARTDLLTATDAGTWDDVYQVVADLDAVLSALPSDLLAEYRKAREDSELLDGIKSWYKIYRLSDGSWSVADMRDGFVIGKGPTARDALREARGKS
jgi:hypothetical protein